MHLHCVNRIVSSLTHFQGYLKIEILVLTEVYFLSRSDLETKSQNVCSVTEGEKILVDIQPR